GSPNTVSAAGSTLAVTGSLHIISGTFTSATSYVDVTIDPSTTLALSGDITVSGNWTNNGTFTSNGFGVMFNGTWNQTISGSTATPFAGLTIADTGPVGNNFVTLAQNISDTSLSVTNGVFDQGTAFNVTSGAVSVSSGATWQ